LTEKTWQEEGGLKKGKLKVEIKGSVAAKVKKPWLNPILVSINRAGEKRRNSKESGEGTHVVQQGTIPAQTGDKTTIGKIQT